FLLLSVSYFLEHPHIYNFSLKSIFSVLYLAYFPCVCGMLSYFYLQKKVNSFYASIVFLIFPFISGYLEYYFYQDSFHLLKIYFIFPLM
ncbi:MAG: EamA family transporter, partial [Buchnera aphidicola]|nr:DMT family transporter [Buchnera aphidicola]MDE5286010.1 EamA family transporter [Buchnera aphidicola]